MMTWLGRLLRGAILAGCVGFVASSCSYRTTDLSPALPDNAESSILLAADGSELITLHGPENRTEIAYSTVPQHVIDAVVSIEDRRFFDHSGVDLRAILRAARTNISEGGIVEGGSTITQQYVKNALLISDRTLDRKIQEASLSFQIERDHSKEEILGFYLNTVYFGSGAYGIEAAAQTYFAKHAANLTIAEGALLAGMIKAPSDYNPYVHAEVALARRSLVLQAMVQTEALSPAEAAAIDSQDISLAAVDPDQTYPAAYFVEEVKRFIFSNEALGATREERINALFAGGLIIETTLDPVLQQHAERAVELVLSDPDADPDAAVVTIDPANGYVLAMVGGRDFFDGGPQSKFNLATQARRPSGSSFKPLVLAAALEEGISLATRYDAPATLEIPITNGLWEVENYEQSEGGNVDLTDATVHSYNTAYAQLVMDVGPADAVATARSLGVESPLLAVPSAVLGANDVSPLDMTNAYATIANQGVHNDPVYVRRVLDRAGNVMWEHESVARRAISRESADLVTAVLRQVVARGTAVNARIGRPVAGKTGTGQNWGDAWFVGYTPDLVTGVWLGFAEGQIPMVPPTTRIRVTGGSWPTQIWSLYMESALAEVPVVQFDESYLSAAGAGTKDPAAVAGLATAGNAVGQTVTSTVGMNEQLATEILTRAGFVVVTDLVADSQYPPGIVVGSEPGPGADATGGSEVIILIANGDLAGRVPNVLGRTQEDALRLLAHAGYDDEVIIAEEDDLDGATARAGMTWKIEPRSGTELRAGQAVTIWINP
ncbi:MAG: PBP1A family penicillin-binding protein [Acidimicrobiales bacterium]